MHAISFPDEVITHGQVLVEPANLDPRSPLHELPMRVCEVGRIKDADDLMPRLIDMATLSADQQQWMTTALRSAPHAEEPPILCAWLESVADPERLVRGLTRFLIGPGVEDRQVYWRYYDPRVLALTLQLFSDEQTRAPCWGRSRSGAFPGVATGGASPVRERRSTCWAAAGQPGQTPASGTAWRTATCSTRSCGSCRRTWLRARRRKSSSICGAATRP